MHSCRVRNPAITQVKRLLNTRVVVGRPVKPGAPCVAPKRWLRGPRPTVVFMVKQPVIGRAKTRLARDVGGVTAVRFYRAASRAVVARVARDPRWTTVLAVAPDHELRSNIWPVGLARIGQGGRGLGHRMQTAMLSLPPGPVAIVGTDIPSIQAPHIAELFRGARSCGAAFGPAPDGGYWAVVLRRSPRIETPFADARWSTEHALSDTIAGLSPSCGTALGGELEDVDDAGAYQRVKAWSGRIVLPFTIRNNKFSE